MVPQHRQGLIIDLGAGTGSVTGALLRAGVPPQRIVAIEKCGQFAATFRKRYPQVPLIVGDACQLNALLQAIAPDASLCAILSSLPFRVLPQAVVTTIQQQLHEALNTRGGILIQYTYAWWMDFPLAKHGFTPHSKQFILKNIPPARVESYTQALKANMFAGG
jgi:phospholipid N-methyltransferase